MGYRSTEPVLVLAEHGPIPAQQRIVQGRAQSRAPPFQRKR